MTILATLPDPATVKVAVGHLPWQTHPGPLVIVVAEGCCDVLHRVGIPRASGSSTGAWATYFAFDLP